MIWIVYEVETGFILSTSDVEPTVNSGEDTTEVDWLYIPEQPIEFWKFDGSNPIPCTEEEILYRTSIYEIDKDSAISHLDHLYVNYKTGLKDGIGYTPVFIKHEEGINAGLIDKTEYYRGYVDENNKGTLILSVKEEYVIDDSEPTLPNSAKPAISRLKTWVHVKNGETILDEINIKSKPKLYNTREKRHREGERRRSNIMEQYIDHIGLAGILSGAFSGEQDAFNKLTAIQTLHSASFNSWKNSGRDPLYTDLENDTTTTWFDTIVPDNGTTQAMIPWIIGMTLRDYTIDKLKGNIK